MNKRMAWMALAVVVVVLATPLRVEVCAPMFEEPILVSRSTPDLPLQLYAEGNLGVPQPDYATSYLIVAYRYMSEVPLTSMEKESFLHYWEWRLGARQSDDDSAIKIWLQARNKRKLPARNDLRAFAQTVYTYNYFVNCGDDAFLTAAKTLEDREKQWGRSQHLADWIDAQDAVFDQCRMDNAALPRAAPQHAPLLLKQDRAYQSAAAKFYKGDYAGATTAFDEIAKDQASPWSDISAYVAIRAVFRQAISVVPDQDRFDLKKMREAQARIKAVRTSAKSQQVKTAAADYERRVKYWLDPVARQAELASAFSRPSPRDLNPHLRDYVLLLTQLHQGEYQSAAGDWLTKAPDLTQWIVLFGEGGPIAPRLCFEKWRQSRKLHWLFAALAFAGAQTEHLPELLAAAEEVKEAQPAYVAISYHRARLLRLLGRQEEAKANAQALMTRKELPPSTINLLKRELELLSTTPKEFAALAPRNASYVSMYGGFDCWRDECKSTFRGKQWRNEGTYLDEQTAAILNKELPLDVLLEVADALPNPHRNRVLYAAWTRAVLLGREDVLDSLQLPTEPASLASFQTAYRNARTKEEKRFVGIFSVLRLPGLSPYVQYGAPRGEPLEKLNNYRDNWWCRDTFTGEAAYSEERRGNARLESNPPFLTTLIREKAADENRVINTSSDAAVYLAEEVMNYAKRHPADARIPEALHRVVRATRFACGGGDPSRAQMSRAAFRLLHARYPGSEWAKKTPFWYDR